LIGSEIDKKTLLMEK